MKKLLLSALMLVGMMGAPNVVLAQQHGTQVAKCKYTSADAIAGLKGLTVLGYVPQKTSPDGTKELGAYVFHDPKSADKESVDAIAIVLMDKSSPNGGKFVFAVGYNGKDGKIVSYRRHRENNELTECFDKTVETPKK